MSDEWNYWRVALLGVIGGLAGGLAMWVFMSIVTAIDGQGVWAMPKWVADAMYGDSWLGFNGTDVFTGLIIHFILSLVLGALFAVIVVPFVASPRTLLLSGIIWGAIVYLVLSVLAMGAIDETMAQEVPLIPWMVANLLFGLVVALVITPLRTAAMNTV